MDEECYLKVSDKAPCFIIKLRWTLHVVFSIFKLHDFSDTASETFYNLNVPKTVDSAQRNSVLSVPVESCSITIVVTGAL
jgi:hypothetical protein